MKTPKLLSYCRITSVRVTTSFGNIFSAPLLNPKILMNILKFPWLVILIREPVKVGKKKKVWHLSHFFYVGGGIRGHCHTFYFMLKMAYNSSRNAKKILGRGGANPLNCHTKWGGIQKQKCDKCHTFFFFYFDGLPYME